MKRIITRSVLGVGGVLLVVIGSALLLEPVGFAAGNGVALADDPSLLSEYSAAGGMLLASGVFLLFSALRALKLELALGLGALVYGSYGVSRLIVVATSGLPSAALTQAMAIELLLGLLCLTLLLTRTGRQRNTGPLSQPAPRARATLSRMSAFRDRFKRAYPRTARALAELVEAAAG